MKEINVIEFMKQLRDGKELSCPECGKGKIVTDYDPLTSHSFHCTECDFSILVD